MDNHKSFRASGTIEPARFVTMTGPLSVGQATANARILGITLPQTKLPPDLFSNPTAHAEAGDQAAVALVGTETMLEAGAAYTAGTYLVSDAVGRGVPAVPGSPQNIGAIALENANAAGEKYRVLVLPFTDDLV